MEKFEIKLTDGIIDCVSSDISTYIPDREYMFKHNWLESTVVFIGKYSAKRHFSIKLSAISNDIHDNTLSIDNILPFVINNILNKKISVEETYLLMKKTFEEKSYGDVNSDYQRQVKVTYSEYVDEENEEDNMNE